MSAGMQSFLDCFECILNSAWFDRPVGGEIDILEQVGNTIWDAAWGSYHWALPGRCDEDQAPLPGAPYPPLFSPSIDFSQDFHVFGVEWNSTQLSFYVDGNVYFTLNREQVNIPQDPFYIILNTAISPLWPPSDNAAYPAYHIIDWVRVYAPTQSHSGQSSSIM